MISRNDNLELLNQLMIGLIRDLKLAAEKLRPEVKRDNDLRNAIFELQKPDQQMKNDEKGKDDYSYLIYKLFTIYPALMTAENKILLEKYYEQTEVTKKNTPKKY